MFFNMDTKQVIAGVEAASLYAKIRGKARGRFVKYEERVTMPSLGNRIAYGYTYEV